MSVEMCCPRCGSVEFESWGYSNGIDRETGYHDCGVRAKCKVCGFDADIEDFQVEVRP